MGSTLNSTRAAISEMKAAKTKNTDNGKAQNKG